MAKREFDVVICGAGVAGISTAYHLLKQKPKQRLLLVDERSPLSLTSDKSSECYRNFWPGPEASMVQMMNRSIDILEDLALESDNIFNMNRRGYVFATARPKKVAAYQAAAQSAAENGAGALRVHKGLEHASDYLPAPPEDFQYQPDGSDLLLDPELIQRFYPELSENTLGLLHIRRAGWLSAQQLGMYMLSRAQDWGLVLVRDQLSDVFYEGGRFKGVHLEGAGRIEAETFVNAAGPFIDVVCRMLDIELPVFNELHLKSSFHDHLGIVPRGAPMLIWGDPQVLAWSEEERGLLAGSEETSRLLDEFPSGVHTRPDGGDDSDIVVLLWEYNSGHQIVNFPIDLDPEYPELALRGIRKMLPGMAAYLERLPKPALDGGYYTKTRENRPLACPLSVGGTYLIGALSGFGIMAAPGLGDLVATQINGGSLPDYAAAFDLKRYEDQHYQELLKDWGDTWQL